MARPRNFDEDAVLDAALLCFWRYGYRATSVRDLADSMGIGSASLYGAFGDKRALYRRALDRYLDQSFRDRMHRFEGVLEPARVIREFFAEIVRRSIADKDRKGCLLVNSALELAPHDKQFQREIASVLVDVESFFRRVVDEGQRAGTVSRTQSAADLARLLLGVLLALRVLARTRPQRALMEGLLRPVFAMLEPA